MAEFIYEEMAKKAVESGFTAVAPLAMETIILHPEVRDTCAKNKCQAYDTNWSCPPACGTLEECWAELQQYKYGILLQTMGELEDSMDYESMMEIEKKHKEHVAAFVDQARAVQEDCLVLGGVCTACKKCTYPDNPCRFPMKRTSSMEAYGMFVSEVCKANDLTYYYGPNTLAYLSCAFFK